MIGPPPSIKLPFMGRIIRAAGGIITSLSLLLFLAISFLWIRSQTHLDEITQFRLQRYICVESVEGRFYYNHWIAGGVYWAPEPIKFGGGELARLQYAHIPFSRQFGPFAYGHA